MTPEQRHKRFSDVFIATFELISHLFLVFLINFVQVYVWQDRYQIDYNLYNRTFSTFNASKELPFDLEDGLLLWLNKINHCNTKDYIDNSTAKRDNSNNTQTYSFHRDHLIEKQIFPTLADINACFKDGITALSVVLFYFPEQITIDCKFNPLTASVPHHVETRKLICRTNQLTGFYMVWNIDRYWINSFTPGVQQKVIDT